MNQNFNNQRDPLPRFDTAEPNFGNDSNNDRAPLPEYSNNPQQQYGYYQLIKNDDPFVNSMVDKTFAKALAAAIMAGFPITSIIAIFFGRKAWKMAWDADEIAKQRNARVNGKNIASKVLSAYGIASGAVCTFLYAYIGFIYGMLLLSILGDILGIM